MKNGLSNLKHNLATKTRIVGKPVSLMAMHFEEEYYDESDSKWIDKARRLQARRWRKIKHDMA